MLSMSEKQLEAERAALVRSVTGLEPFLSLSHERIIAGCAGALAHLVARCPWASNAFVRRQLFPKMLLLLDADAELDPRTCAAVGATISALCANERVTLRNALVNEANVKILVKELLSYLIACDVEFKDELTQRICHVVEKYAKDHEWHVDTIIQTLLVSTSFESEETVCSMIALITSNPDLHAYATHKLYATLASSTTQPVLLQLAIWCVGEYGELLTTTAAPDGGEQPMPTTVVELLAGVLRSPIADMVTNGEWADFT